MPLDDTASVVSEGGRPLAEAAHLTRVGAPRSRPRCSPQDSSPSALVPTRCSSFRQSFACAYRGLLSTVASQRNMRIQCGAAVAVAIAGLLLHLQPLEWVAIVLCAAAVFSAEITNTAIEAVVDLSSPGYSELARIAKDAGAAAVLVAAGASVIVGLLVLGPHLLALLRP